MTIQGDGFNAPRQDRRWLSRSRGRQAVSATLLALAALAAGCTRWDPPAVTPLAPALRAEIQRVRPVIAGRVTNDTSRIAARGSSEGALLGSRLDKVCKPSEDRRQTGCWAPVPSSLAEIVIGPIVIASAAVIGAASARSVEEVDAARIALARALDPQLFATALRERFAQIPRGGTIEIAEATEGNVVAETNPVARSSGHLLFIDFAIRYSADGRVNPDLGIVVAATGRLTGTDGRLPLHVNNWTYCGPMIDFVEMAKHEGARVRADLDAAAQVLAKAIIYDTFVSTRTRSFGCMDFSDVP